MKKLINTKISERENTVNVKKANTAKRLKHSDYNHCERCGTLKAGGWCEPYCDKCKRKVEILHRIEQIIPKLYRHARMKKLSKELKYTIAKLPEGQGLFLWGVPGVGKTYAMAALARYYIIKGFNVERVNWGSLGLMIRNTFKRPTHKTDSGGYVYDGEQQTELDIIEPLLRADKLFIEDVGTSKSEGSYESDFAIRTLERLLDERLENGQPTFITTNKSVEELAESFDDRIASRIIGGCKILELIGKDKRKTGKENE